MEMLFLDECVDQAGHGADPAGDPAGERQLEAPAPEGASVAVARGGVKNGWRRVVPPRWLGWVVALAGVMMIGAGWIVPSMVRQSQKDRCMEQLKRLGRALHDFHEAHKHFPAGAITDAGGKPLLSWRVAILPQLGYQSLYDQFHLDEPWDSPHNLALAAQMPPLYACPSLSDRRTFVTGYQVVVGPKPELGSIGTLFEWARGVEIREVLDGTSNTVMVVETKRLIPWTQPDDPTFDRDAPLPQMGSDHPAGFHVLLADGTVRFLKDSISPETLRTLLTRDGGEVISA
jgi:hypothetical protein